MQTGRDAPPYVLGQRVFGAIDGVAGTVVSVDMGRRGGVFAVRWSDGTHDAVVYPENTIMVRKGFPWE